MEAKIVQFATKLQSYSIFIRRCISSRANVSARNQHPLTRNSKQTSRITHPSPCQRSTQEKMKVNADEKTRSQQQSFTPGLTVLVRQKKKGKLSPPFNPQLYTVTKLNGSMVKASHNCHEITRYSSFYKIIPKPHSEPPRNLRSPPDDDEEAPTTECNQQTNPQPQGHPYYLRSWSKVQQST